MNEEIKNNEEQSTLKQFYNSLCDNGLPIPLVRNPQKGRGDIIATAFFMILFSILFILVFGGSNYHSNVNPAVGLHITIPSLNSMGSSLTTLSAFIATLIGYVMKRKDDIKAQL